MVHKTETAETRGQWIHFIYHLQDEICKALEEADGRAMFSEDAWQRAEGRGGGGLTRVIQNGAVFEKGGVNTSVVYGHVTDKMRTVLKLPPSSTGEPGGDKWFAAGLSLVIHPLNPFVPTVHCNYRMFELYNSEDMLTDRWFGGGTDLTPYYLFEEDARHFHQTYKNVCDGFDPTFYPAFKKTCDDYFVNTHRGNERRGIGGIFYDHKRMAPSGAADGGMIHRQPPLAEETATNTESLKNGAMDKDGLSTNESGTDHNTNFWMAFGQACGHAFLPAYLPIVERRKQTAYNEANKHWQEIRRGRYVEFNLVHDRGTLFGLRTAGRTESILMSLPPTVRFEYNYQPAPGSEEDRLWQACLHPRDWV